MSDLTKGYCLAVFAAVGFGVSAILTRATAVFYPEADFLNIAFWGWGIAMTTVTISLFWKRSYRRSVEDIITNHQKIWLKLGGLGVLNGLCWFYAITIVEGGVTTLVDLSIILWSFLLGIFFLGEQLKMSEIPGILIAVLGLVVISALKNGALLFGIFLIVLANLLLAWQSLILKKYQPKISHMALTFCRAWFMWAAFAIPMALLGLIEFGLGWDFYALAFVAMLFGIFISRGAYITAHAYLPISRLSLILLLKPVVALLLGWWWLQEPLELQKLFGAGLIIVGIAWFILEQRRVKLSG